MKRPLPLLVLSGFLGAGKTALVRHLLNHTRGRRVAVLVNDHAAGNRDAGPPAGRNGPDGGAPERVMELSNGCLCCTRRPDFIRAVARLADGGHLDYLLVVSTGLGEPLPIAEAFHLDTPDGRLLGDLARPDAMVTVIDARAFLDQYQSIQSLQELRLAADATDHRHLVELLVTQVEEADLLVLNKTDLIKPEEQRFLMELLGRLNPAAEVVPTTFGRVAPEQVLHTGLHAAARPPAWSRNLAGDRTPETQASGITSFVYRAGRPFHPGRLWRAVKEGLCAGLLRSKGFVWLATRLEVAGLWSQAGRLFSLEPAGHWWAAVAAAERPRLWQHGWHPEHGDRRQEIACIGRHLDAAALAARLDACLLTAAEMDLGEEGWRRLPDPLPAWDLEAALAHQRQLQPALL